MKRGFLYSLQQFLTAAPELLQKQENTAVKLRCRLGEYGFVYSIVLSELTATKGGLPFYVFFIIKKGEGRQMSTMMNNTYFVAHFCT